ncbi:MAG: rRNA maturation RNase YbeY [Alistipes sp.]|nr:rRNA maturation RNase YbeY [Alistipes sp.]
MVKIMAIKFYNERTDFRLPAKRRVAGWIRRAVEEEGFRLGTIVFIFCGREHHLGINRTYLQHDWPTDVITFDYSVDGNISGDIFIDPQTVEENARELCVAPEVEMRRVMVHGVLHLCGGRDKTTAQRRRMRTKEDYYLARYYGKDV